MQLNQRITPCLWFDNQAEEAANFYRRCFRTPGDTRSPYGEAGQEIHERPAGSVMTVVFELEGQSFTALKADRSSSSTKPSRFRSLRFAGRNRLLLGDADRAAIRIISSAAG